MSQVLEVTSADKQSAIGNRQPAVSLQLAQLIADCWQPTIYFIGL